MSVRTSLVLAVLYLSLPLIASQYVNQFAVTIDGEWDDMEAIAQSLGFTVEQEMPSIQAFVLSHSEVEHRSKRSSERHLDMLRSHPKILYAQQEQILIREKRQILHDKQEELMIREITDNSVYYRVPEERLTSRSEEDENKLHFKDPHFGDQWYLRNDGSTGGEVGLDLNTDPAWANGFTGKGIVVCVLDDGIDYEHPDLKKNFNMAYSKDLNDPNDTDGPMPDKSNPENKHGTRCAGELVAEANNSYCGVGIAFDAQIGGIRILDGKVMDVMEAEALNFMKNDIHIYSSSWGPRDNGKVFDGPYPLAAAALKKGVKEGRGGLGSIYIWATGNGGAYDDDCGADGYVSSIESISFGSVTDQGKMPFFMEKCTSTMAVVPTGGSEPGVKPDETGPPKISVVTTDVGGRCMLNFMGTSSAAPLAAGAIALALQANNELTWRDVQHLVVHSARIPSVDDSWAINGAGFHFSHKFGFGLVDTGRLVQLAQTWKRESDQRVCTMEKRYVDKDIYGLGSVGDCLEVDACKGTANQIDHLEHVQVRVKLEHSRRGDIQIHLLSPSGTKSELLSPRSRDDDWEKGINFTFMSVHFWLENPIGTWKLTVTDKPFDGFEENQGFFESWELTLFGIGGPLVNDVATTAEKTGESYVPDNVEEMMNAEKNRTKRVNITPYQPPENPTKKEVVYEEGDNKLVQYLLRNLNEPQQTVVKTEESSSAVNRLLTRLANRELRKKQTSILERNNDDYITGLAEDLERKLDRRELTTLMDILTRQLKETEADGNRHWLDLAKDDALDDLAGRDGGKRNSFDRNVVQLVDRLMKAEQQDNMERNLKQTRENNAQESTKTDRSLENEITGLLQERSDRSNFLEKLQGLDNEQRSRSNREDNLLSGLIENERKSSTNGARDELLSELIRELIRKRRSS